MIYKGDTDAFIMVDKYEAPHEKVQVSPIRMKKKAINGLVMWIALMQHIVGEVQSSARQRTCHVLFAKM